MNPQVEGNHGPGLGVHVSIETKFLMALKTYDAGLSVELSVAEERCRRMMEDVEEF